MAARYLAAVKANLEMNETNFSSSHPDLKRVLGGLQLFHATT